MICFDMVKLMVNKVYILLYADDPVMFAESDAKFQAALNALFCTVNRGTMW